MTFERIEKYLEGQANRMWSWHDDYEEARRRAEVLSYVIDLASGKYKVVRLQRCAACGAAFKRDETQVDHIQPVVPPERGILRLPNGRRDWNDWFARKFCSVENLQVLCLDDHAEKTGKENKRRKRK